MASSTFVLRNVFRSGAADEVADDWLKIGPGQVYWRALQRIQANHRGTLLLHDIQPVGVALPAAGVESAGQYHHRVPPLDAKCRWLRGAGQHDGVAEPGVTI
jgi:hypothetical protein